ncbi:hypothetical protein SAMN05216489_06179 [Streptomyces sp. 3213]|nr:hypothetical protein SAMN05216489_06179 [Streptomyces sp. 3213] [Streptomyces sp. 3213.3]
MRTVRNHSRYVPEATHKEGLTDLARQTLTHSPHDFGSNVFVSVVQVSLRSPLSQLAAFAVYMSA